MTDTEKDLKEKLTRALNESADWKWAHDVCFAELTGSKAFDGASKRMTGNKPIPLRVEILKLKAELAEAKKAVSKPDWRDALVLWLSTGARSIYKNPMNGLFRLRDEALGRQVEVGSIKTFIESPIWAEFNRKP